jgi:hypothetical protein
MVTNFVNSIKCSQHKSKFNLIHAPKLRHKFKHFNPNYFKQQKHYNNRYNNMNNIHYYLIYIFYIEQLKYSPVLFTLKTDIRGQMT